MNKKLFFLPRLKITIDKGVVVALPKPVNWSAKGVLECFIRGATWEYISREVRKIALKDGCHKQRKKSNEFFFFESKN